MFAIKQQVESEKWVLTWKGIEFPQDPVNTGIQAQAKLENYQRRYPAETFELLLAATDRRQKIGWRWTAPDGQTGVIVADSKYGAMSVLRYNLRRQKLPKGLEWEPVYD